MSPQKDKAVINYYAKVARELDSEDGSQLIEFIALLPLIFMAFLIGWQFLLAGHTFIVTANAAREGARAAAVCNADIFVAIDAAKEAIPEVFDASVIPIPSGEKVSVTVRTKIPVIQVFSRLASRETLEQNTTRLSLPDVVFTTTMRKERKCRAQ